MSSSYAKLGELFVDLFAQFNWTVPGMIYNNNKDKRGHLGKSECYFTMEAIFNQVHVRFREKYPSKTIWNKDFDEIGEMGRLNLSAIVQEAGLKSRSKYFCTIMILQ